MQNRILGIYFHFAIKKFHLVPKLLSYVFFSPCYLIILYFNLILYFFNMSISSIESEDKVTGKYGGERVIGLPSS